MNFPDGLFSSHWSWAGLGIYAILLLFALLGAPWRRLQDSDQLNVFLGVCVSLMLLWTLRAGVVPGLNFHLLGATLLVLMFGVPPTTVRTRWMLGFQRRLVRRCECEMLCPKEGPLPQTSQLAATGVLLRWCD